MGDAEHIRDLLLADPIRPQAQDLQLARGKFVRVLIQQSQD